MIFKSSIQLASPSLSVDTRDALNVHLKIASFLKLSVICCLLLSSFGFDQYFEAVSEERQREKRESL